MGGDALDLVAALVEEADALWRRVVFGIVVSAIRGVSLLVRALRRSFGR